MSSLHPSTPQHQAPAALPDHLAQAVWRGDAMGRGSIEVIASGHALLDAELPGGGWPCHAMTEVLQPQYALAEWRLLGPVLARIVAQGGCVLLISPPYPPHLPALHREGLRDDRLIRVDASTPAERLWATEQALKAGCVSAVLSWLPQARAQQIRRLQACASRHPGPFFVFRPVATQAESSAAPLRLVLSLGACPHPLQVDIVKRRGPLLARPLCLPHWPLGLLPLLPTALPSTSRPAVPTVPARVQAARAGVTSSVHHAALDRLVARGPANQL